MLRFYQGTAWWLTSHDHNHLRITRILNSLGLLIGLDEAQDFYKAIIALNEAAGSPVNPVSLSYWERAAKGIR